MGSKELLLHITLYKKLHDVLQDAIRYIIISDVFPSDCDWNKQYVLLYLRTFLPYTTESIKDIIVPALDADGLPDLPADQPCVEVLEPPFGPIKMSVIRARLIQKVKAKGRCKMMKLYFEYTQHTFTHPSTAKHAQNTCPFPV